MDEAMTIRPLHILFSKPPNRQNHKAELRLHHAIMESLSFHGLGLVRINLRALTSIIILYGVHGE